MTPTGFEPVTSRSFHIPSFRTSVIQVFYHFSKVFENTAYNNSYKKAGQSFVFYYIQKYIHDYSLYLSLSMSIININPLVSSIICIGLNIYFQSSISINIEHIPLTTIVSKQIISTIKNCLTVHFSNIYHLY